MENNTVVTHDDLIQEMQERQNGVSHSELGETFISSYLAEDPDFLEHHGIKGMKWGVRRYQNKDGSLTKAGLKRYGQAVAEGGKKLGEAAGRAAQATKAKISEKYSQRKEAKRVEELMSKPIRKLTAEELNERTIRTMKEKELRSLEKNVRDLSDGAMSKGRKFCEDLVTKVAIPSVLNAGEKQLTAFLNKKLGDALGLGEKDSNLMRELIDGNKQLRDLTDGQINKLGKAAESWGNVSKFVFGKNSDQNDDSGDVGTLFKDIMSGKLKTSDLTDGQLNKGKKLAEAADAIDKQVRKQQTETDSKPESDSKPKTDTESKPKSDTDSKPKTDTESKPKSDTDSKPKTDTESKPKSDTDSKPKTDSSTRSDFGDYKMKSVEEMSSYGPVKSGKSVLSKAYDSGYTMRSVEDLSSHAGIGQSYAVRELYNSGYRMAPMNDK